MHRAKPSLARNVRGGERRIANYMQTESRAQPHKTRNPTGKRLYVLDTNVLMHDPSCLYRFQEHDVFIPDQVLEELDNNKTGNLEKNKNAREASRSLDTILSDKSANISAGIPLNAVSKGAATGRLFLQMEDVPLTQGLNKPDNLILAVVSHLMVTQKAISQKDKRREVVLVTNDVNMRIKARKKKISVEGYRNDSVIKDTDLLPKGSHVLPSNFWERHVSKPERAGATSNYKISGPMVKSILPNEFVCLPDARRPFVARVMHNDGSVATLQTIKDYSVKKNAYHGILARNMEQNFAFNLLFDQNVDLVILVGEAGSGKTLLALVAGIAQVMDARIYNEIIITRTTIPVGEDIGSLPGTEEEKMNPWMEAFNDNIEVILGGEHALPRKTENLSAKDFVQYEANDAILKHIKVKSMNFMRGRTFLNKYLIIDEGQNLTGKQMRTMITRAGPGTKVVILGNLAQIDTPYLTEKSSGLTYLIDRFHGWEHGGHVILVKGERSRLANHANDVL